MSKEKNLFIFLIFSSIFLIVFSSISLAAKEFVVGVSPRTLDGGEIEKGSSKILKFYIVTPSDEKLMVRMEGLRGNLNFFQIDEYNDLVLNYSEEDSSNWIEFLRNPVELKPGNETLKTKAGVIKGWQEITFILNVPKNAEPGYHNLIIRPMPIIPAGKTEGQAAGQVVAVTAITVLFKTQGNAIREGDILDIVSGNYNDEKLEVNIFFQNKGTVTMQVRANEVKVSDKNGRLIDTLTSGLEFVKPGETKVIKTFLDAKGLSLGTYNVSAIVDYGTGSAMKDSSIELYEKPKPVAVKPTEAHFPWWLLIIIPIIIIILYLIYRRI